MRNFPRSRFLAFVALAVAGALLVGCGRGRTKADIVQGANIPAGFDVTITADKDSQFDFDGAPLTAEDLKSAFRYRQEQSLPMASVLLQRGEKEKVKKEHLVALARIAYQMKFKAYVKEGNGEISELQAQVADAAKTPVAEPAPKHQP